MTTAKEASQLLVRANPAPDEPRENPVTAAGYLATLKERSREMQTIEKTETRDPGGPQRNWTWLIAAAVIAVLATVGLILMTGDDEAPVATTPQVEEPEPVPSTAPESLEEPEPTTPSTEPEPEPVVEGPPIFDFQTEPGDYLFEHRTQSFVFTSDGEWAACTFRCSDWTEGLTMTSRLVSGGIVAIDPSSSEPDSIKAELEAIPGLIVGEWTPVEPTHPDATWAGQALSVDIADDAGTDPFCQSTGSGATYPCAELDLGSFGTFIVHGPITLYVLESDTGRNMLVTPFWGHEPLPTDEEFAALSEHLAELVGTIRFVD